MIYAIMCESIKWIINDLGVIMAYESKSDRGYKREQSGYKKNNEHWEIKYSCYPPNTKENQIMGSDFNPVNTKNRYKTYNPVNETDT